ncbi:hypothetical protein [Rhodococcus baikonurensis]|uniref:Vitamin K epoxide reductase family protein n=2 Tax=Bacteria TaxID=2 RepID=A0ABV5XEV2_9NOCA
MSGIRIAWVVLAVATGILGSATAQWPLYEITDCEIGLGPLSSADCYRSIHDYFGRELFLVLALPVALCVIPAVIPRPLVSWIVSATMLCAAVLGFFAAFSSDMPSLLSMVGSLPAAVLALVLAVVHQGIALRNKGAIARARSGVRDTQPSE